MSGVGHWGQDGEDKGGRSGYFIGVREVLIEKVTFQQRPEEGPGQRDTVGENARRKQALCVL